MLRYFAVAVLLAGCAGPRYAEMQQLPPAAVFTTERSPDVYAACLAPKLLTIWSTTAVIPDGPDKVVAVPAFGANGMILTVTAKAVGRVEFREMKRIGAGSFDGAIELAKSCL